MTANVIMYSAASCPFCARARELLDSKKIIYQEIRIDENPEKRSEMIALSGRKTVPQLFINQQSIGGCDDLYMLDSEGQLDKLLGNEE